MTQKDFSNLEDKTIKVEISGVSESDIFWKDCGKKMIQDSIDKFDECAKFLITTCASLIVINFGLLLAFTVHGMSIKIAPQLFLVTSAAVFVISYFPALPKISPVAPDDICDAHNRIFRYKLKCHYLGLGLFIAGLLAMGITNMISKP